MSVAAPTRPLLALRGVEKRFGDNHVLKGVDLDIAAGEVVCLIGPSGSGKTTLLRCVNHLEVPSAGHVVLDGELIGQYTQRGRLVALPPNELAAQRQAVGMVFQHFNLFAHKTALDNIVEAPRQVKRAGRDEARTQATELLRRVGLADKGDSYPRQLSGGQQAARGDRPRTGDESQADAVRRADLGAGPRDRRRGARRDAGTGRRRHDDARRHP